MAAAKSIAAETGDTLVDIGIAYKYKTFDFLLEQGESLGFVFPIYGWTTPPIIDEFLKEACFFTNENETFIPSYTYVVLSYGGLMGNVSRVFGERLLQSQGINLDASFSVKSVGNCTYLYAPAEGSRRAQILATADKQARRVAFRIKARKITHDEKRNVVGNLLTRITESEEKPRSTKEFHTLPVCINCGLCADICPTNTVSLINETPRWAEMGCTQCLACLHRCPTNAIQYGKKTEKRGRYVNPVLAK